VNGNTDASPATTLLTPLQEQAVADARSALTATPAQLARAAGGDEPGTALIMAVALGFLRDRLGDMIMLAGELAAVPPGQEETITRAAQVARSTPRELARLDGLRVSDRTGMTEAAYGAAKGVIWRLLAVIRSMSQETAFRAAQLALVAAQIDRGLDDEHADRGLIAETALRQVQAVADAMGQR